MIPIGTHGVYGFHRDDISKITYNHYDSYPEHLGKNIIDFCLEATIDEMNKIFDQIVMVQDTENPQDQPTPEQIKECMKYFDGNVSTGQPTEWYALLRNSQGDLNAYKRGLRYMIDSSDFIKDSLFCEWGYIINLSTNMLEVYKGFQKSRPPGNRYNVDTPNRSGYWNCKLIAVLPLELIKEKGDNSFDLFMNLIETGVRS